jgi:DNA-directed RNA polymerase specialized sigma24 family protein
MSLDAEMHAQTYSLDEIRMIFQTITDAQKTALMKIAKIYACKTRYGHQDLIQEAYMRVLDGRRQWPRNVGVVPFLGNVMRSIKYDWRVLNHDDDVDVDSIGVEDHAAAARVDIQKIIALFDDDPVARKILMARMKGVSGEELREISGLTKTEFESKCTKIRRRLEKLKL